MMVQNVTGGLTTTTLLRNLQPFASYEIKISAYTAKGEGPSSVMWPARTHQGGMLV